MPSLTCHRLGNAHYDTMRTQEQTLDEIALILGKEANAVKVQLHRARGRLKEKMQKYFSEEVKDIY